MMITWYYNRYGQVLLWKGMMDVQSKRKVADRILDTAREKEFFFKDIGKDQDVLVLGESGVCKNPGYFQKTDVSA
ncbi:hypothetical protein IMZ31_19045 (plasmid) [Pontibacillus sp. ALD_SL1]|uniref:hypothetical protein n=1 Tax=Pontibacillus sp. ALD_SL1 TaxID=2777185 RepID=UPI001A96E5F5|nr:hypothetical protein [Pontibacillus sp. ALD_SL1]QST02647.1 hypothetical protein IMZ31_19045 [Pontibacillus sp. ALD_SL1]